MSLAAIAALLTALGGIWLAATRWLARRRLARVTLDRDVARGQRVVATAQVGEIVRVEARKDAAVVLGEDFKAEVAAIAAAAHAATPAAGVPVTSEPTPAEVVRAADEARRNARTRAKIVKGRGGK